jgi:hypothetical protein
MSALALPSLARAAPEPVRVEYVAFAEPCPDHERFAERLAARASFLPAPSGAPARVFRVILAPGEAGIDGVLEVVELDGSTSARSIAGATCDEAVSALALVAALAIEERAADRAAALEADAPARSREEAEPEPEPAPAEAAAAEEPVEEPPAESTSWMTAPSDDGSHGPRVRVGASFDVAVGRTPDALFGAAVAVGVEWTGIDEASVLAGPDVRLALAAAPSALVVANGESARFTWWTARVEGCPAVLSLAREVRVAPCAVVEAGALVGSGEDVVDARTAARPWVALGASVRVSARVAAGFEVELGLALVAPVVRDRFVFLSGATVLEVPEIGGLFDFGGSFSIP